MLVLDRLLLDKPSLQRGAADDSLHGVRPTLVKSLSTPILLEQQLDFQAAAYVYGSALCPVRNGIHTDGCHQLDPGTFLVFLLIFT
jgi:hypothetical protein